MFSRLRTGVAACWLLMSSAWAALSPQHLRTEYLDKPLGLDELQPRLGWTFAPAERGAVQSAYQIVASSSEANAAVGRGDLWDSGRVASAQTTAIRYMGAPLGSGQRVWWSVRVWDGAGAASGWSRPAYWEMGLLSAADWHGAWIGRAPFSGDLNRPEPPLPLLRRGFKLDGAVKQARVYVCGLGYFELYVNGRRIGDHLLDPGYTRYDKRVLYVTHDVTAELRRGDNALGVMLGNGWYNVSNKAAWDFDRATWRASPRLLLELRVEYADGRKETISSDEQWKTSDGPITFSNIYGGENYDARREQPGWDEPRFDDRSWQPARRVDAPHGRLVAQAMHPIRLDRTIKPIAVTQPVPGVYVFDAGQNLTGDAELSVSGPAGTTVTLRYAEVLGKQGRADQSNIAIHVVRYDPTAQFQTDQYTLKGHGIERWHSRFNYNGFRYVEVSGAPGPLTADALTIRCFHTALPLTGEFESSNPVLNRIWQNGRWSYFSDLFGIPTDCPHREKNGWTGDAQVAMEQGLFYGDGITVYEKWARDLEDAQFITGALPGIVPTSGEWGFGFGSGPAWDSALLLVPWQLYQYYGDATALTTHYEAFRKYVDYLTSRAQDGIVAIGLMDWSPAKTHTPPDITDTAYYYRDARIVAAVARMLGKNEAGQKYDALADSIRAAFNRRFYHAESATYGIGSQTSLGCALYQGLVDPADEPRVVDSLVAAIQRNDNHLDFGYLGAKYVPNALTAAGHADVAYRMLLQPTPPSYAWQVEQGATTLWEEWNGTGSQNHTFFGDVNAWMMKTIAGIAPDPAAPGFSHFIIHPHVVGDLKTARGTYESVRGRITSEWSQEGRVFRLKVEVPVNTRATVYLPAAEDAVITESGQPVAMAAGVVSRGREADAAVFDIGSGQYAFTVRASAPPDR